MRKIDNQQNSKEIGSNGENYKMSLDILSSLKSIPGKIIKLQSGNFQPKKENFNKDKSLNDTEEKISTFNTLPKDILSNESYYINILEELRSQNFSHKQYPYNNQPQLGHHTQNYFNHNSLMPFPNVISSNHSHMIYPYKTLNSVCLMKSNNCFKEFKVNPSNYIFNKISIPVRKVSITQIPINVCSKDDDNMGITQKKNNNLFNIENINKNKINIKNNESNFEIADKNSESNLGDVVRDIISTEKKDNLKNEILKIQTFREKFEKEAVKKEFENKKSIIEKVEELKNKWDLEDKELKLTREFEDKLLEITRTHEDKEKENKRLMEDIKKKHEREIILKEMEIKALKIENEELEKKIELNNGSNFFIGKKRDISEA